MGYPSDLLSSRAVVKPGLWAVIPKDGLVNNVIPYMQGCRVSIVASPKMGASFVQYVVTAGSEAKTTDCFAKEENVEGFLYLISGSLKVTAGEETKTLTDGGYILRPGKEFSFGIIQDRNVSFFFTSRYIFLQKENSPGRCGEM